MFFRRFFDASAPESAPEAVGRLRPGGYRDLSPQDAHPRLDGFRLVDVREPGELHDPHLGRIAGAVNLPMGIIERAVDGFDVSVPVLLICRSGRRSAYVASELVRMGFPKVYNLAGGMIAWNEAGLPVLRS